MSQYALHTVFTDPDQAKAALLGSIGPYCREQWARGVQRLSVRIEPEEDSKSIQQRKYLHGVIYKEIAEQATIAGQKYDLKVWKSYLQERFIGHKWEVLKDPMTGKKKRRKVRVRSEDLGIKAYSKLIEEVTAFAVTDLGVIFSVQNWESYR
ncbi:MAG: hypothetical protein B7Y69_09325 [Sphingobacteriia bacterium 35-40-8]|jgi:hypothetical protein|nr:MAG: hypothetical protein B7Y69_09325 [Sphingobacteriia bacterium 35-40-8]